MPFPQLPNSLPLNSLQKILYSSKLSDYWTLGLISTWQTVLEQKFPNHSLHNYRLKEVAANRVCYQSMHEKRPIWHNYHEVLEPLLQLMESRRRVRTWVAREELKIKSWSKLQHQKWNDIFEYCFLLEEDGPAQELSTLNSWLFKLNLDSHCAGEVIVLCSKGKKEKLLLPSWCR